jgi:hypothetical protein
MRHRYETPATIVVEDESEEIAHNMALTLGATLDGGGPGAAFHGITVAVVDVPVKSDKGEAETLSEYAESLQAAAGMA